MPWIFVEHFVGNKIASEETHGYSGEKNDNRGANSKVLWCPDGIGGGGYSYRIQTVVCILSFLYDITAVSYNTDDLFL